MDNSADEADDRLALGETDPHVSLDMTSPQHRTSVKNMNTQRDLVMKTMRDRFKLLQMLEDEEQNKHPEQDRLFTAVGDAVVKFGSEIDEKEKAAATNVLSPLQSASGKTTITPSKSPSAATRWNKLRKVVRTSRTDVLVTPTASPRLEQGSAQGYSEKGTPMPSFDATNQLPLEEQLTLDDINLKEYWNDPKLSATFDDDLEPPEELTRLPEPIVFNDEEFKDEAEQINVLVSRIPQEMVTEQAERSQLALFNDNNKILDIIKKREVDVIWRENLARERVKALELEAKKRLQNEKDKMVDEQLEKERHLSLSFRRVREELERGIKRQLGAVQEQFGRLLVHEESLARRFMTSTVQLPQPIEFRIHMMRAVKTKLKKGAYVIMLTQYDSLGGHPLSWSQIGATGIGAARPGITKVARHNGRYFDRTLRFEDSVFALCPPRGQLKPSNVFVLELFQLANRFNPFDTVVAWAALPMVSEGMSIVEGKFKIPFLKGEPTPNVSAYKDMERSIAGDLSTWLCNCYFEVRHMSLNEIGASESMLRSTDYDLDFLNKTMVALDKDGNPSKPASSDAHNDDNDIENNMTGSPAKLQADKGLFKRKLQGGETGGTSTGLSLNKSNAQVIMEEAELDETGNEGDVETGMINRQKTRMDMSRMDSAVTTGTEDNERTRLLQENTRINAAPSYKKDDDALLGSGEDVLNQSPRDETRIKPARTGFGSGLMGKIFGNKSNTIHPHTSKDMTNDFRGQEKLAILGNIDDDFLAHRQKLVKQWKENLARRGLAAGGDSDEDFDDVRERGYDIRDDDVAREQLHPQQRGKLLAVDAVDNGDGNAQHWASAALEGRIVRRYQSDGIRLDSEALEDTAQADRANTATSGGSSRPTTMGRGVSFVGENVSRPSTGAWDMSRPSTGAWDISRPSTTNFSRPGTNSSMRVGYTIKRPSTEGSGSYKEPHNGLELIEWKQLRDDKDLDEYTMAVVSDPSNRKRLMPGASARSKTRYLMLELFGDLLPNNFGTFDFYATLFVFAFAFWLRIYVHFLAQYLYLKSLNIPVFGFKMYALQVIFKYMSEAITTGAEVGVVAMGPIANICLFLFFSGCGYVFYKIAKFLPDVISQFFAAFGVAAVLDPLLTFFVDVGYHNYDCEAYSSACDENYVDSSCNCFQGDFIKLWNRMERIENSGLTGAFIITLLYMGVGVIAALLVYNYLVHIHKNGRILDLWRRINGPAEEFFMPFDFEMSSEELNAVLLKSEMWRGANGDRRLVVVSTEQERDTFDPEWADERKRFTVYDVSGNGRRSVFRQFTKDSRGVILEVFESLKCNKQHKSIFSNSDDEEDDTNKATSGSKSVKSGKKVTLLEDAAVTSGGGSSRQIANEDPTQSVGEQAARQLEADLQALSDGNANDNGSRRSIRANNVPPLMSSTPPNEHFVDINSNNMITTPGGVSLNDGPVSPEKSPSSRALDSFFADGPPSRQNSSRIMNSSSSKNSRQNSGIAAINRQSSGAGTANTRPDGRSGKPKMGL